MVVGIDPAGDRFGAGEGCGGGLAEEQTGCRVRGVEALVSVELGQDAWVVGEGEEGSGDRGWVGEVEADGWVGAKVAEVAEDCGWNGRVEAAHDGSDLGRGAVGVQGSVDEEPVRHEI